MGEEDCAGYTHNTLKLDDRSRQQLDKRLIFENVTKTCKKKRKKEKLFKIPEIKGFQIKIKYAQAMKRLIGIQT